MFACQHHYRKTDSCCHDETVRIDAQYLWNYAIKYARWQHSENGAGGKQSVLCLAHLLETCRAFNYDYVYIDYVRRSRSSSCRLLRPIVKLTLN